MRNTREIGSLLLRVVLGITFFAHGLSKFQGGIDNIGGWFHSMGIPSFMAYVVATIELVGGIAIILGLGTRIVSAFNVLIMAGAILVVKLPAGLTGNGKMPGYELELSLMIIALYLVLNGSRFLSIDSILVKSKGESRVVQN
ncbi:DoxX family protein [Neobacillus drentensis]|uniref:DoxX family protein n=1 Tax=Neobacillus drentensis TaxID=220684 RepID=UPI001F36DEC0|nr:DoxX family protein [Neobacillus drentensis]ULT54548.1 DoxX family protein [Neobacillus drentensis]